MIQSPATLVQVREFLTAHDVDVAPWADPQAPLDALSRLLRARRDDDRFWADLAALTRRLRDARVRPELVEGAEVLGNASIDHLIGALRRHLGEDQTARAWATGQRSAPALAAFLVLGAAFATGCGKADTAAPAPTTTPPPTTDTEPCAEAVAEGLVDDEASVYCELIDLVRASDLSTAMQSDLIDCLTDLAAAEREAWLAEFQSAASDAELEELLYQHATTYPCFEDSGTH
jgi:hypothetical protein